MLQGIDVSYYQKNIDWQKVKPSIDFAILRCGYGSDYLEQDDKRFTEYANECERLNIPYGVYLYSYATTDEKLDSEIKHTLRVIKGRKPFCVYIDMEDAKTVEVGKAKLTEFAKQFCRAMQAAGYKAGVYANQNWFKNYLDVKELHAAGFSIWCARYSDTKPNIDADMDIWQYTSSGHIDGINGNVDMNIMYNDIRNATDKNVGNKKSVDEIANEVIKGRYGDGSERKERLEAEGYSYREVQDKVNEILRGNKTAKPVASVKYYPKYRGNSQSIVDALKSLKIDASYTNRKKIAEANGLPITDDMTEANEKMLILLKQGKLVKY